MGNVVANSFGAVNEGIDFLDENVPSWCTATGSVRGDIDAAFFTLSVMAPEIAVWQQASAIAAELRSAGAAGSEGTIAEQLAQRGVTGFTNHGVQRAAVERGFTDERVLKVISEGESVVKTGRYGTDQIRYTLGQNTVVVETGGRNAGKVITTFSSAEGGGWVEP